ncbi:MAG TPA: hypothetical protein VFC14_12735 [Burkholderiales bacterium]|nr:hypothetical protein [Burkholderiales bacterium]
MSVSQHPSSKQAGPSIECEYLIAMRRDVALAAVITALMLGGVAVGASLAARQESLLIQPVQAAAVETLEFDYFPSRYVNQGVESSEDLPTF